MNSRNPLLTVLEVRNLRPRHWYCQMLVKAFFPIAKCQLPCDFLLCPHMEEGAMGHCGVSFIRILIPFMRAPASQLKLLVKSPSSKTVVLCIKIFSMNSGGHSDHNILPLVPPNSCPFHMSSKTLHPKSYLTIIQTRYG